MQRGFWYSAHENWKLLLLPYSSASPTASAVFQNAERARTRNSAEVLEVAGLYASVNDPKIQYVSDLGIGSIAFETVSNRSLFTPYGAFPVILQNASLGLEWFRGMQISNLILMSPYGTLESYEGSAVGPLMTWDSKMTTLLAACGGLGEVNAQYLKKAGVYARFATITEREYSLVFSSIVGSHIAMSLPPV